MHRNRKKGRILRIKTGYNPNSSSMGSIIFALPVSMMALSGGFAVASGLILSQFIKSGDKDLKLPDTQFQPDDDQKKAGDDSA